MERQPLSTYEQAVNRLCHMEVTGHHSADQMALAVQIVADVFWYPDSKVRHDVAKAVRSISRAASPSRRFSAVTSW